VAPLLPCALFVHVAPNLALAVALTAARIDLHLAGFIAFGLLSIPLALELAEVALCGLIPECEPSVMNCDMGAARTDRIQDCGFRTDSHEAFP
jgi:hypothetical protein